MRTRLLLLAGLFCCTFLSAQGIINTVAGGTPPYRKPPANALNASFGGLQGVALNSTTLYFADSVQHVVYAQDASGNLSVVAGVGIAGYSGDGGAATAALLNTPTSVAFDSVSNALYIADSANNRIRKVSSNGTIVTYAGNGSAGFFGDGGAATAALLGYPSTLTFDAAGNLYFSDSGTRVRMVSTNGNISTIANSAGNSGSTGDGGPATAATFSNISGLVFDNTSGSLYVADSQNNVVRRFTPGSTISTVAGTGTSGFSGDGGAGTKAKLKNPQGLSVDSTGNLYIADKDNEVIRFLATSGTISTVAGNGGLIGNTGDGGPATAAGLSSPYSVVADPSGKGKAYILDSGDGRVRVIKSDATIATVAGNGQYYFGGDGGAATSAFLNYPFAVTSDAAGNLYIADAQNNRVRKVDTSGNISTIAGNGTGSSTGDGGQASLATVNFPGGVAVDATGNIYISEVGGQRIRKINPAGQISTIAGNGTQGFSGDNGQATSAALNYPAFGMLDGAGNFYFVDYQNFRVREVTTAGVIKTVAGNGQSTSSGDNGPATSAGMSPAGLAVSTSGDLYISDGTEIRKVSGGTITKYSAFGSAVGAGLALDAAGDVIVCAQDKKNGGTGVAIITPALVTSILTATQGSVFGGDGGPASAAEVNCQSVGVDKSGNILVADAGNNRIRKISTVAPQITVSPASVSFTTTEGTLPTPQSVTVSGTAGAIVQATTSTVSGGSWLNASPGFAQLPGPVTIAIFSGNLTAGTYQGTVTLTNGTVTSTIAVTLTVNAAPAGQLVLTPSSIVASSVNGASKSLTVSASGSGTLAFSASASTLNGQNWLSVVPTGGTVSLHSPAQLTLSFQAGLAPGLYTGQVTVTGGGSTLTTPVRLVVPSTGNPIMVLSQTGLNFAAATGAGIIPQQISVGNAGSGAIQWTASVISGSSWLSLSGSTGTSQAQSTTPSRVVAVANPAGLAAGTYYGLIKVASTQNVVNAPQYVTAVLRVSTTPASSSVYPQSVILTSLQGSGGFVTPQLVTLLTASASPVQVSATGFVPGGGTNWLTVTPQNSNASSTSATLTAAPSTPLQISANPGSLAAGVYGGTVTATFLDGSPAQDVRVSLVVAPGNGSGAGCTPTRLVMAVRQPGPNFSYTVGLPAPIEVQIYNDCGQPVSIATVFATFNNGDAPLVLTSAGGGIYAGMWKPSKPGATEFLISFCNACTSAGTFTVYGQVAAALPGVPSIGAGGIVNGASFAQGADIAPGTIFSAFGANLATSDGNLNGGFPLPTTLAGIKLTAGNVDAPLFYAGTGQVNAQLPSDIPVGWQTQVVPRSTASGTEIVGVPEVVTVGAARPGIFIAGSPTAPTQGAILDANNKLVDAGNPVSVGGVIVIFATGLGLTTPPTPTGVPAAGGAAVVPVSATIGGIPVPAANVQYAGPAPGFVGLYQVNVAIPTGVQAGNAVSVTLTQNGITSNTATIAVK